MTGTTATTSGGRPVARRRDEDALRLAAVVGEVERVGVDGFARTRAELDRARELEQTAGARGRAASDAERQLVDGLAAGRVSVDDAALELAAARSPGLDEVVDRAVRACRRRAGGVAVTEAAGVHAALAARVAGAVADAVAAGRRCVDVPAVVRALRGDMRQVVVPPLVADAPTRPDWPAAVKATERVDDLVRVARMLPAAGGPTSTLWAARHAGEAGAVAELVPVPLHLAVGDELGWGPGLFEVDDRGDPTGDGARAARAMAVAAATEQAPLRSALDRLAGRG